MVECNGVGRVEWQLKKNYQWNIIFCEKISETNLKRDRTRVLWNYFQAIYTIFKTPLQILTDKRYKNFNVLITSQMDLIYSLGYISVLSITTWRFITNLWQELVVLCTTQLLPLQERDADAWTLGGQLAWTHGVDFDDRVTIVLAPY